MGLLQVRGIQDSLRAMFNPHFGSTFRSHNNPTYFSRKLFRSVTRFNILAWKETKLVVFRFSDIYTSRVTNLLQYSLNHSFYPRSQILVLYVVTISFSGGGCFRMSSRLGLFKWRYYCLTWNLDWTLFEIQSFDLATPTSHFISFL